MVKVDKLVSIVVITYQSAEYVIETLDSITKQSYQNIELIVSDDGSQDNTVALCEKWISENKSRFYDVKMLTVKKNMGVPANCNRGISVATGEWVKIIAGDDLLHEKCIDVNIEHVSKFPDVDFFFSNMLRFENSVSDAKNIVLLKPKYNKYWNNYDVVHQYKLINNAFIGNTPTFFCRASIYNKVMYDETIRFMEDYPFVLNILKKGFRTLYIDRETVYYRFGNSASNSSKLLFNRFYIQEEEFRKKYIYNNVSTNVKLFYKYDFYRKKVIEYIGMNNRNIFSRVINKITILINPFSASINKKI